MIDGSRIWLTSGSVHYFRTPRSLWADRLLKAKRAGLNCIDTYVAWNFHEPQEGKWNFSGDHDVAAFVRLAGEMGLYVILRPGPYICAEWDFGGLPSWLTTKPGMAYRTNNASYTHYYDKYFRQVLGRLADLQVTRDGNIILIQNENEYYMTTMPDRLAYMDFISQLFRRSGFDIPIITCNILTDPPVADAIECVNGYSNCVQYLKQLRLRQPAAPLLVTEFWPGWFDYWGGDHQRRGDRECARRALEIIGCGSQINYYMWHGGTNFAFWASRMPGNDSCYQTTSYDYDAPLAEGGGLTEKYYLTKLVNMLSTHMGRFLATCSMGNVPASVHDSTNVMNLSGSNSQWAIISNNGRDDIKTARVSLPAGQELIVSLEAFGAAAVPFNVRLPGEMTLDYTNLMPLGFFNDKTLVLHGPAGFEGVLSVNGAQQKVIVPEGDSRIVQEIAPLQIVVINTDLARRTWLVDDSLVLGPAFVGSSLEQVVHNPAAREYALISADGKITIKKVARTSPARHAPPRLSPWKLAAACSEPTSEDLAWQKIDRPKDLDNLGIHYGYAWQRIEIDSPKAAKRHLLPNQCEDRATIYHNGKLLGTWGRGADAARKPMPIELVRGRNVLTLLLDNMGRLNYGPNIGELRGMWGHIYDAKEIKLPRLKLKRLETFPRRLVPRRLSHLLGTMERLAVWQAKISLPMTRIEPVFVTFKDVPHHVAIQCNDRLAAFLPMDGGYGDVTLSAELHKGKNQIELLFWGDATEKLLDNFRFYSLMENLTASAQWSFRPWELPAGTRHHPSRQAHVPAWYTAHFPHPHSEVPLFLHLKGHGKGQIFLNGANLGRYWLIGPQEYYYLPSSHFVAHNEIMIFSETGVAPSKTSLEFRPAGPYR